MTAGHVVNGNSGILMINGGSAGNKKVVSRSMAIIRLNHHQRFRHR